MRLPRPAGIRAIVVAVGLGVPIAAFWNVLVAHSRTFFAAMDNTQQAYPWFQKLAIAIHHGYLPVWDSGVEGGFSFAGEIQTAVFYPVNIAFVALFGTGSGITLRYLELLIILHFALAFTGMYVFSRRSGFERAGAVVSALIFSYTGPHAFRSVGQVPIFASYSLIPLAQYFTVRFAQSGKKREAVMAGAVTGCQILAGHVAAPLFSILISAALLVGMTWGRAARIAIGLGLIIGGTLASAAPQLIFGYQHFVNAYRVSGTASLLAATAKIPFPAIDQYSLPPTGLFTLLLPERFSAGNDPGNSLFMGVLPLAIVVLTLSDRALRLTFSATARPLGPLYVLGVGSLLIALGGATPFGRLWYALPVVGTLVREPGRYGLVFEFALCTLIAHLLTIVLRERKSTWRPTLGRAVAGGVILLAILEVYLVLFTLGRWISVAIVALTTIAFLTSRGRLLAASLIGLGAIETAFVAATIPFNVASPEYAATFWRNSPAYAAPEQCYPTCRLAIIDPFHEIPINLGDVFRLQATSGYTALVDSKYQDVIGRDASDGGFESDLLNVRYLLSSIPLSGLRLVGTDPSRGWYVYERASAFPRVFSLTAALDRTPWRNDVIFSVEYYSDIYEVFRVTVPKAETVVFSEQFYPGWSVTVDRVRAPMLVAAVGAGPAILRAVRLTRGPHVVSFSYPSLL